MGIRSPTSTEMYCCGLCMENSAFCYDYVFDNGEISICTDKFNTFFIYPEDKEAINFFKKMMWGEDNFYFKTVIGLQKLEDFITIYNKNIDNGVK